MDFVNDTITIDKTLCYVGRKWFLSTPKTESSFRTISLNPYLKKALLKHKCEQDKLKAIVGDNWVHPDTVFTSEIGNYYDRTYVNKRLKKVLESNDLPIISTHGLRHTNASIMINSGYDIKFVSELLGHCNIAITGDIYSHIFDEYKAKIAKSIEDTLIS